MRGLCLSVALDFCFSTAVFAFGLALIQETGARCGDALLGGFGLFAFHLMA